MAKIRAFIAVELDSLREELRHIQDELRPAEENIRWVVPENIHLTVLFLGYIEEKVVPIIKEALHKATKGIPPFELSLKGAGAFPSLEKPKVIWVGVENGAEELSRIHSILAPELSSIAKAEKRPFSPHITLGRINPVRKKLSNGVKRPCKGRDLVLKLQAMQGISYGTIRVERIVIKESRLRKEGPEYLTLGCVNLLGENNGKRGNG